jgi:long-chain acyl-CoA synthetase
MIGDRRKFVSLLVVPDFAQLEAWARESGISFGSRDELVRNPRVVQHVEKEILGSLTDLASFEQPKKIALLAEDLTVENGFLTPSLKVKRRVVQEKLVSVIDALYQEGAVEAA